ncbi:WXG100 family type VII secretion target [Tamaricihabitans halophyticus]|uniref:ESAT-6-like protein n=1 Tax=Tamaricihabitans halophyticus TaxID=1262583 RepID=A0A4R2QVC6_9PSEU|nr:WXG100 family type VII secretion target [Tamaricihabitans halophyticus]TCP53244.1 WXG100 family type VII secretion target [Tamaricihabitans halophyticus]
MAGFQTGAPELRTAAGEMVNTNTELQGTLRNLANEVQAVSGMWKGQAEAAFQQLMTRFQEDAAKLNESLMNISEAVTGSADAYEQQEEDAAQSVSAIQNMLG